MPEVNAVDALENPPDPFPEQLFLMGALIFWCDRKLIDTLLKCEKQYPLRSLERGGYPILNRWMDLRPGTREDAWTTHPDLSSLKQAWIDATRDLALRILEGQLVLEGVPFGEDLHVPPQVIPGAFAMRMQFDFADSTVKLGKKHFLAVKVSRQTVGADAVLRGGEKPRSRSAPITGVRPVRQSRGGRENYNDLIREAVAERWDSIHVAGQPSGTWTAIAGWLAKHLRKKYPDRSQDNKLPCQETIRTRLPSLYQELLASKSVR